MKNFKIFLSFLLAATVFTACDKNDNFESPKSDIVEHTLKVYSVTGDEAYSLNPDREGYINLYDGLTYSFKDAKANAAKIDFVYKYNIGANVDGPLYYRAFFNMAIQASVFVEGFGTITKAEANSAESNYSIHAADFDAIKTSADIETLFSSKKVALTADNKYGYLSNQTADMPTDYVIAFVDKNGKKGFFSVDTYASKVPQTSDAAVTIHIKIQQ